MFQRLRGIKQNGVLSLVFHGAEHSRFAHSLGASHLAGRMYDSACRNSGLAIDSEERKLTTLAALLHDVGHGPFSHLLEEILGKKKFHHEKLTIRILTDERSTISHRLREHDANLPEALLPFIDYKQRKQRRWYYAIASSQLDADRLDYTGRDAMMTGVVSHRFDRDRLINALCVWNKQEGEDYMGVDDRAHDVVENYLLALHHLYRSIYFHRTARAASWLLSATLRRARDLALEDEEQRKKLFPDTRGKRDPLWALISDGNEVPLDEYVRLDEAHVWGLVQQWRDLEDPTLLDLCDRLKSRRLPKALELPNLKYEKTTELIKKAKELIKVKHPALEPSCYVNVDEIDREDYKPYRWGEDERGGEPILLVSKDGGARPIEEESKNMLNLLDARFELRRLIVHEEIRSELPVDVFRN